MFENDQADFLLPFELYKTRVEMLDQACESLVEIPNPNIVAMYRSGSVMDRGTDDEEFVPWRGHIERFIDDEGSRENGFDALEVTWMHEGGKDTVSAWEISVVTSVPIHIARPSLSEEEKQNVQKALAAIMPLTSTSDDATIYVVESAFGSPVNEMQYSDYSTRVEIPMDLGFISQRLATDYYGNKLSIVSDIRLIRENCAKYNGDLDPITLLANDMVKLFEELVLSEDERNSLNEFDAVAAANAARHVSLTAATSGSQVRATRTRLTVRNRSVLEHLDVPSMPRASGRLRASRRQSSQALSNHPRRGQGQSGGRTNLRRSSRQVGRVAPAGPSAESNHSSLLQLGLGRGRNRSAANAVGGQSPAGRFNSRQENSERMPEAAITGRQSRSSTRERAVENSTEVQGQLGRRSGRLASNQNSNGTSTAHSHEAGSESSSVDNNLRSTRARSSRGRGGEMAFNRSATVASRSRPSRQARSNQTFAESDSSGSDINERRERTRKREINLPDEAEMEDSSSSPDEKENDDSDDSDASSDDINEEEEEEEEDEAKGRRTRSRVPQMRVPVRQRTSQDSSPSRSAGRRARLSKESYADPSSSEFDDDVDEDVISSDDDSDVDNSARAQAHKRRAPGKHQGHHR